MIRTGRHGWIRERHLGDRSGNAGQRVLAQLGAGDILLVDWIPNVDQQRAAIARRIGGVSWEFLAQVSRYPDLVPAPVREELASRIGRAWEIAAAETLERIAASGPVPKAASRGGPFPPAPSSFEELLERSSLGKEERSYWTRLAESSADA